MLPPPSSAEVKGFPENRRSGFPDNPDLIGTGDSQQAGLRGVSPTCFPAMSEFQTLQDFFIRFAHDMKLWGKMQGRSAD